MSEPVWIENADCRAIHEELLHRFGGIAGIRDEGLLESAVHRPRQRFTYGEPRLYELAACYATGIVKNHPFLDGNKRSGFLVAALFLEANGYNFSAPEEQVVERTFALAAGAIGEAEYAKWLENSCAAAPAGKKGK